MESTCDVPATCHIPRYCDDAQTVPDQELKTFSGEVGGTAGNDGMSGEASGRFCRDGSCWSWSRSGELRFDDIPALCVTIARDALPGNAVFDGFGVDVDEDPTFCLDL